MIGAIAFTLLVVVLSISGVQPLGLLFGGLTVVLPLIAMYFIVRWAVGAGLRDAGKKGVERYARGEIGRDEYEQVRRDLETR